MAVKGGASPFRVGDYKGLFQKESEEFRMEHQRDKRPIYSLSSFPVLERQGETVKDKGGKHSAHLLKEERPSVSHALDRSPRRKGNDAKTKMSLEDELEINNPELFNSLREVKRTLRGHSMKRFQQFESLAMMNPLENSVRATAALRVDLIRRTGGLGVKAELEDDKLNKNDETSLEVQLEQALMFKDLEDLRAFKLKESSEKYETQYEKNRKMKRAMQSRTLEIQREAEAVSKALSRALEKYRGAIKETLQEPKVRRDVARSLGRGSFEGKEDVSEEVGTSLSPDSMSKEEKRQALVHSANSNVDKAKGVLERLKLYTQTVYAFQHAGDADAEAPKDEEDEASDINTGAEKEKEEAVSQPEKSAVTAKPDNKSRPSTSVQKSGRIRTKRSSIAKSSVKVDQEYEEELARARETAKREEDERKYQQAILLPPIEGVDEMEESDVLQARFERIWDILDMPLMQRMEMVIRYTSEEGLDALLPVLDQYERCAGGLKLYNYLRSEPTSQYRESAQYKDLEIKPEYVDRCREYIRKEAFVLWQSFGDELTLRGKPLIFEEEVKSVSRRRGQTIT